MKKRIEKELDRLVELQPKLKTLPYKCMVHGAISALRFSLDENFPAPSDLFEVMDDLMEGV